VTRVAPDPYRLLFPLGILFGLLGAAVWPLHALGLIPYPGQLHWTLMIQGFQHCFILGFLLTAMPSFLHAERCKPIELLIAVVCMAGFGLFSLAGWPVAAQALYVASLALVASMAARRFRREEPPPEEFLLAAFGLAMGMAGGLTSLAVSAGWLREPAPRFGLHLISLGMVLTLVLGVGSLLVPTFSAMKDPLVIPGLAKPHERKPRRILYASLGTLLVAALALEALGHSVAAAWLRTVVGSIVLLWVWKILRRPGVKDLLSYCLWIAGWMILAGLWTAAILSGKSLVGYHLVFIGGFGLLTLGIGTRVVVRHGRHPLEAEGRVLRTGVVMALGLTLVARVAAESGPARLLTLLGVSGTSWIVAWLTWGAGAAGYIRRVKPAAPQPFPAPVAAASTGVRLQPPRGAASPPTSSPRSS